MPRVLIIVPPYDYNDTQLLAISEALAKEQIQMMVANSTGQPSKGEHGSTLVPDADFYHVDSANFDGAVFIGGTGSSAYQHNRRAQQLAREFFEAGKPVAAIGLSPTILANAQILRGKRATGRPTERDAINALGTYTGAPVEVDGNIITALSTVHVAEFATAIIRALKR